MKKMIAALGLLVLAMPATAFQAKQEEAEEGRKDFYDRFEVNSCMFCRHLKKKCDYHEQKAKRLGLE